MPAIEPVVVSHVGETVRLCVFVAVLVSLPWAWMLNRANVNLAQALINAKPLVAEVIVKYQDGTVARISVP